MAITPGKAADADVRGGERGTNDTSVQLQQNDTIPYVISTQWESDNGGTGGWSALGATPEEMGERSADERRRLIWDPEARGAEVDRLSEEDHRFAQRGLTLSHVMCPHCSLFPRCSLVGVKRASIQEKEAMRCTKRGEQGTDDASKLQA